MERSMAINNKPHADELWAGIGGHFDSLGQILNEFIGDGITPSKGILLAATHPDSVKELILIVNEMYDAQGNKYNFETKTWQQEGIVIQK